MSKEKHAVDVLCPFCKTNTVKIITEDPPKYSRNSTLWYKTTKDTNGSPALAAYAGNKPLLILCAKEPPSRLTQIPPNTFAPKIPEGISVGLASSPQ